MSAPVRPEREQPVDLDQASPELVAAIAGASNFDELNAILTRLTRLLSPMLAPGTRGHKLYARDVDRALAALPRRLGLADRPAPIRDNSNVCIIATEFYDVGGHSRVVADITRLIGGDRVSIILTDIYRNRAYRNLLGHRLAGIGIESRAVMLLKSPTVLDRTIELYSILSAIRPSRIFLLNHHMDACAIVGALPFRDVAEFVHHADYEPALGATLPFAAHADLVLRAYAHCHAAGLSPVYASMALPPLPAAVASAETRLTFATSGHATKFLQSSAFAWKDWVVAALAGNEAQFIHIGAADDALKQTIAAALEAAGVSRERYVFVGPVRSVGAELKARGVSVYVASAPEGGARACLEALFAGVPVVVPYDPSRPPLIGFTSPLPGWTRIDAPTEMPGAVQRSLALRPRLASPAFQAELEREVGRFGRYVAGERLERPAPLTS